MSKILVLFLIVPLLAACAPQINKPTEPLNSGVKGQVFIGPMCPVVRVDTPCPDEPYQAALTVLTLDGREVTRFKTDAEGKFTVNLPPGDYVLHPETPENNSLPFAPDVPFTVIPDEFTNIIVTYDSGIR